MLKIRLQRVGRKHQPVFRVVLTDSRNSSKSGKFNEVLGVFDHTAHTKKIDAERVKYWLSKGAQPSVTIHNYLVSEKIIEGKKRNALPKHRPIKKEEEKKPETKTEEQKPSEVKQEEVKQEEAPVAMTQ
jgi:small subunit ribosomal protein S16